MIFRKIFHILKKEDSENPIQQSKKNLNLFSMKKTKNTQTRAGGGYGGGGFSNQGNTLDTSLYTEMDIMNPDNNTNFI